MFCHRCGAKNPDYSSFCSKCGTALIQSQTQQIEPAQPVRRREVVHDASERADYGYTKGKGAPLLLLFELLFSAIFAGLLTLIVFQFIIHGTISTPVTVGLFVTGFVIFFAVIHYGKLLRK